MPAACSVVDRYVIPTAAVRADGCRSARAMRAVPNNRDNHGAPRGKSAQNGSLLCDGKAIGVAVTRLKQGENQKAVEFWKLENPQSRT